MVHNHERRLALARPVVVAGVVGVLFALCFAGALHSPTPHQMDVAIVAPPQVVQELQGTLQHRAPDAFHLEPARSEAAAKDAVLRRQAAGAFIADPERPTLLVAGARGLVTRNLLTELFGAVASGMGSPLSVQDVRPVPDDDRAALSPFLLTVSLVIPSILLAGLLAASSTRTRAWHRLGGAVLGAVALGFLNVWIVDGVFGAMPGHYIALAGSAVLVSLAVSLPALALHRLLGLPGLGLTVLMFIVFGMPATGTALGPTFLPRLFRDATQVFPAGEAVPSFSTLAYFPMASVATDLWALAGWALAGAAILLVPSRKRPVSASVSPEEWKTADRMTIA